MVFSLPDGVQSLIRRRAQARLPPVNHAMIILLGERKQPPLSVSERARLSRQHDSSRTTHLYTRYLSNRSWSVVVKIDQGVIS